MELGQGKGAGCERPPQVALRGSHATRGGRDVTDQAPSRPVPSQQHPGIQLGRQNRKRGKTSTPVGFYLCSSSVQSERRRMAIFLPLLLLIRMPIFMLLSFGAWSWEAGTELSFASYYADHMVLQKEPVGAVLWGYGASNTPIMMYLYKEKKLVLEKMMQVKGRVKTWKVVLSPMPQGGPYHIVIEQNIKGNMAKATLKDVYFGDVWLCSGQSNMQMTVSQIFNASKELADASKFPLVRVFAASLVQAEEELQDLSGVDLQWSVPTAEKLGHGYFRYFSALCWLFGRHLFEELKYPIGLVESSWGGTPIETWSSKRVLRECGVPKYNHSKPTSLFSGPFAPSVLWNAMIHPLLSMTLRGAIWYQGETNTQMNTDFYNCTFPALIEDWRKAFHDGSAGQTKRFFPFGFVQLSTSQQKETDDSYPRIRWHQTADFGFVPNKKMPNTFMAVALDLCDDKSPSGRIHPRDKQTVAYRLHLGARAVAYGEKKLIFQGPYPQSVNIDVAAKLINVTYGEEISLEHSDNKIFEVCCSRINTECIWSPVPMAFVTLFRVFLLNKACPGAAEGLRYAWTEQPCEYKQCPIYNLQALPAPPFITFSKNNPGWIVS